MVYSGIMMGKHNFTKLEGSGFIYIEGVEEAVNHKTILILKVT